MPHALRHPALKENETTSDNPAGHTLEIKNAPKPVMTVPEAADVLGISRTLAYDLIGRHELPAVRLGRRILVPQRAIEELIASAFIAATR